MKKLLFITFLLLSSILCISQKIDDNYVKGLYSKYPTIKSNFCSSCKEWDNPYFKSIADTQKHMPLITYYVYTSEHEKLQESLNIPRTGIYAKWHPVYKQPKLDDVYTNANNLINKHKTVYEVVWGHCIAWITLAYDENAVIFSDTEDFNEGMEYQGQNIGTEIATENLCRSLVGWKKTATTDSLKIWCGTYGNQGTFSNEDKTLTVVIPEYYWKHIEYYDRKSKQVIKKSWFMPNKVEETTDKLNLREIDFNELVKNIGFDPTKILN